MLLTNKMAKKQDLSRLQNSHVLSPVFYGLKTVVILAIMFYILESSFLAREGLIEEATIVGFAVTTLAFFIFAFSLILGLAKIGYFGKVGINLQTRSSFYEESRDYWLGFGLFFFINLLATQFSLFQFSVLNIGGSIFSQAGEVLGPDTFKGMLMNTVSAPLAEEIAFFFLIPLIFIFILTDIAKNYKSLKFLDNMYVQFLIYAPITAYLFAGFHVGQEGVIAFFVSALIFRMILLGLSLDSRKNIFNGVFVGVLFAIGGHMANNIVQSGGLIKWITIMASADPSRPLEMFAGWGTLIILGLTFVVFVFGTINRFRKKL